MRRRVFISADMEGVAGVVASEELRPGNREFESARRLLTNEVNAAIRGVRRADAAAAVVVADSHANYRNILPTDLDAHATLLRGKPRALAMVEGVRAGDEVLFIGYHPRAGVPGTLSHTFNDAVRDIRCNDRSLGEVGLNAAVVSELGAKLLLVTGNDELAAEVRDLSSEIPTVIVSTATSSGAAESLHPSIACTTIEDATFTAITDHRGGDLTIPGPIVVDVDFMHQVQADNAAVPPPITRTGTCSVQITAPNMMEAYQWIRAIVGMAAHTPS